MSEDCRKICQTWVRCATLGVYYGDDYMMKHPCDTFFHKDKCPKLIEINIATKRVSPEDWVRLAKKEG